MELGKGIERPNRACDVFVWQLRQITGGEAGSVCADDGAGSLLKATAKVLLRFQRNNPHLADVYSVQQEKLVVECLCPIRPDQHINIADNKPRHFTEIDCAPRAHRVDEDEFSVGQ